MKKKVIILISIIMLLCSFVLVSNAFEAKGDLVDSVSYGISILLKILWVLQVIAPTITLIALFLINYKNLTIKKLLLYALIAICVFLLFYYSIELVLKTVNYNYYSSGRMDMITIHGRDIYVHK